MLLGTIVNSTAIVICSGIGILLAKGAGSGLPKRFEETILKGIGLAVFFIGISGSLETKNGMCLILSVILGGAIGELINIDKGMNKIGEFVESKLKFAKRNFTKGFVTATILFCSGSMAIVGAIESGLIGDHQMLFAKSILDGITSIIFAYQMGIGVLFSAVPVLLYQGSITLISMVFSDVIPMDIIVEMGAAGSLVVAAIGINFLTGQEIKVANFIPAVFLPIIIMNVMNLF